MNLHVWLVLAVKNEVWLYLHLLKYTLQLLKQHLILSPQTVERHLCGTPPSVSPGKGQR